MQHAPAISVIVRFKKFIACATLACAVYLAYVGIQDDRVADQMNSQWENPPVAAQETNNPPLWYLSA